MNNDFSRFGVFEGVAQQRIGFLLTDTFGMFPFIAAVEPLRAANRYSKKNLYSWHLYGESSSAVLANNAMPQPVEAPISEAANLDRLIVCGPHEPHEYDNAACLKSLRKIAGAGTKMGAIDTGSFLLAKCGLIGDRQCTIHWENLPGFVEEFPTIRVSSELFEFDGNLFTCAGGDASLDMILTIIKTDHGHDLAAQVAELFVHSGIRGANEPQRMGVSQRTGVFHPGLLDCVELMEANIEQPLTTLELAEIVSISKRQLERLFRAHMHTTPTHYYQQIRLKAGRKLLEQTSMTVLDVAVACGFASAGHFSKRFRAYYGQSPRQIRQQWS